MLTRRGFLGGLIAAPAIVRVQSIMPVKLFEPYPPVLIPLSIRRVNWIPVDLATEICSVQPMSGDVGRAFTKEGAKEVEDMFRCLKMKYVEKENVNET